MDNSTWNRLLKDKRLPLADSLTKKYVFFHCRQSMNRTPFVASGYEKYLAQPNQRVIIIEGGFIEYEKSAGRTRRCSINRDGISEQILT